MRWKPPPFSGSRATTMASKEWPEPVPDRCRSAQRSVKGRFFLFACWPFLGLLPAELDCRYRPNLYELKKKKDLFSATLPLFETPYHCVSCWSYSDSKWSPIPFFYFFLWKWQLTRQRRRFILSIDARFVSYIRFRSIRLDWTPTKKARKGPPTLSPLPSHSLRNERPHLTLKKNFHT